MIRFRGDLVAGVVIDSQLGETAGCRVSGIVFRIRDMPCRGFDAGCRTVGVGSRFQRCAVRRRHLGTHFVFLGLVECDGHTRLCGGGILFLDENGLPHLAQILAGGRDRCLAVRQLDITDGCGGQKVLGEYDLFSIQLFDLRDFHHVSGLLGDLCDILRGEVVLTLDRRVTICTRSAVSAGASILAVHDLEGLVTVYIGDRHTGTASDRRNGYRRREAVLAILSVCAGSAGSGTAAVFTIHDIEGLRPVDIGDRDPVSAVDDLNSNRRRKAVGTVFTISTRGTGFAGRRGILCQVLFDDPLYFRGIYCAAAVLLQFSDQLSGLCVYDFISDSIQSQGSHFCHALTSFN